MEKLSNVHSDLRATTLSTHQLSNAVHPAPQPHRGTQIGVAQSQLRDDNEPGAQRPTAEAAPRPKIKSERTVKVSIDLWGTENRERAAHPGTKRRRLRAGTQSRLSEEFQYQQQQEDCTMNTTNTTIPAAAADQRGGSGINPVN